MSEKFKKALIEAKEKMLPKLHKLDDTIEDFIKELEKKINAVDDNPVWQRNAHQLLADMSKEHGEFILALRAVVNAVDREGMMIPKQKGNWNVRDVNSNRNSSPDNEEGETETPSEDEEVKESIIRKKLMEVNETIDKKLFVLGRQVNDNLPPEIGLRPKDADFAKAAKKLGISKPKAIKAWNVFTWG